YRKVSRQLPPLRRPPMGSSPRTWKVLLALVPTVLAFTAVPSAARAAGPAGRGGHGHADPESYISFHDGRGYFPLVAHATAAPLVVSGADFPGVVRVVGDLRSDVERVTGVRPEVTQDETPSGRD